MPSTFFGLTIATSGMTAGQLGVNTSAHNISNVQTTGYSKQTVNLTNGRAISFYQNFGMVGTGVEITDITQARDAYLDKKYRNTQALLGEYNTKNNYMTQFEQQFNEFTSDGFTVAFDSFFDTVVNTMNDASDLSTRNTVVNYGQTLTDYMNNIYQSLYELQEDVNLEVKNSITRINSLSSNIATLNDQINVIELTGKKANDLRDQRNNLLDELAEIVPISVDETDIGAGITNMVVKIDGQTLVNGKNYHTLYTKQRTDEEKYSYTDAPGMFDIYWDNDNVFSLSSSSLTGSLKGLLDIRDGNNDKPTVNGEGETQEYKGVAYYLNKLNVFSATLAKEFNTLHYNAYALDGYTTNKLFFVNGNKDFVEYSNDATVEEFFRDMNISMEEFNSSTGLKLSIDKKGVYSLENLDGTTTVIDSKSTLSELMSAAGMTDEEISNIATEFKTLNYNNYEASITADNMTVNPELIEDPSLFCAAPSENDGVSSNEITKAMHELKYSKLFQGGTPYQYLTTIVAEVAIDKSKCENLTENYDNIKLSVTNQRLSLSGVDENEEAVDLSKYQSMYNLCSKVISILSEMYDKLIEETGV